MLRRTRHHATTGPSEQSPNRRMRGWTRRYLPSFRVESRKPDRGGVGGVGGNPEQTLSSSGVRVSWMVDWMQTSGVSTSQQLKHTAVGFGRGVPNDVKNGFLSSLSRCI